VEEEEIWWSKLGLDEGRHHKWSHEYLNWSHRHLLAFLHSWMGTDLASVGVRKFNLVVVCKVHWGDRRENACSNESNA